MPLSGLTTNHVDRTATRRAEALFSFWVALLTVALAAAALAMAVTTPPRSGPEREGFEPSIPLDAVYRISSAAPSTN